MLIESDRHTPDDLRVWSELEAADKVHGRSNSLIRKVRQSRQAVRDFLGKGPCYLAVSGGKDSSVLWHLVWSVTKTVPTRWLVTEPLVDPYCRNVLIELKNRFPMENFCEHTNWCRRDEYGWHATGTLESGIKAIQSEVGTDRYILGVRADESSVRKLSVFSQGIDTGRACRPLAYWTVADVYGYAAINSIPLHPTYGMSGGGRWPRRSLRVSFLGLTHGTGAGRSEWEREYYGDVLRRIAATR